MKLENACLCVEIAEKGAELTRIFNHNGWKITDKKFFLQIQYYELEKNY